MNKDSLLIKCKEVIESLNSEIEEERIAYKILKEESKKHSHFFDAYSQYLNFYKFLFAIKCDFYMITR